jgi:hypothetical protein
MKSQLYSVRFLRRKYLEIKKWFLISWSFDSISNFISFISNYNLFTQKKHAKNHIHSSLLEEILNKGCDEEQIWKRLVWWAREEKNLVNEN